jgi:uncharacterized membrane protein
MKMRREIGWLSLLAVCLAGILAPAAVLAQPQPQPEKDTLLLNIVYDNFNSLKAGEQRTVFMEVRNNGYAELSNIRLTAESPEGWTVEISPAVIDSLPAGYVQTVDIILKSPENASKSDYNIAIIAQTDGMRRVTSIYVRVESGSLLWVWVAAGLAAVLIAGFVLIFLRFGREEK